MEYARAHHAAPDVQYAMDANRAKGYPMLPYSKLITARWGEYMREHGLPEMTRPDKRMQESFGKWLHEWVNNGGNQDVQA